MLNCKQIFSIFLSILFIKSSLSKPDISGLCLGGICVDRILCVNGTVLVDGDGFLDIRLSDDSAEPRYCQSHEQCCLYNGDLDTNEDASLEGTTIYKCGYRQNRNNDVIGRTAGESPAVYAEFPWMVAILTKQYQTAKFDYRCGGSLIHPKIVLTAAHCVESVSPKQLKVRAGEWDTRNTNERWPHQDRDISEIIIHERYYKRAVYNDIALLVLSETIPFAENVNTICLPPQGMAFDGKRCLMSGWGKDNFGRKGKFQQILKKIVLPVVTRRQCQNSLRKTKLGRFFRLHNSFICSGGEMGQDSCKGDGGSPLVCGITNAENRFYQAGIVSWGIGCKTAEIPAAYVNVALFRPWIDAQMARKKLDTIFYTHF